MNTYKMPQRRSPVATPEDMATYSPHDEPPEITTTTNLPHLELTRASDVDPVAIDWLWKDRFPIGKLSLLCGDPGKGKSHVTIDIGARTSTGNCWPDSTQRCEVGSVIYFSAEDDIADTIRPRLDRAGADVSKVYVLESVKRPNIKTGELERVSFSLAEHLPLLEQAVQQLGDVKLIVIDPISSYTGGVDSHKNAEVRTLLAPLAELAARHGIAVIAVTHLSKGSGGKAVYRATGSLAFAAAARAVWMIAPDLEDPASRILLPVKCNIAAQQTGLRFRIQSDVGGSFVAWEADPVAMTADGYLSAEAQQQDARSDDGSVLAEAVTFVREQLSRGPIASKELAEAAAANCIKPKTLERARSSLGIKARRSEDGKRWMVSIPEEHRHGGDHEEHGGLDDVGCLLPDSVPF